MSCQDSEIYWLFQDRMERFTCPRHVISAFSVAEVIPAIQEVESEAESGRVAIGFMLYEAAPAFDSAMRTFPAPAGLPLLWFAVFDALNVQVDQLPPPPPFPEETEWTSALSREDYERRFNRARDYIGQGDIYQVNLTFPFHASLSPEAFRDLFFAAAARQVSDYRCYMRTPSLHVASLSPELFFERDGHRVTCRPMKGTVRRGRWPEEDLRVAEQLRRSAKEQAENLMIVDLLRNDLGRVARTGTVDVPSLFTVERYQTLWQMTSTVTADVGDVPLWRLLQALFPCGSVTGAPKIRSMEIIRELEVGPRGVYCGAIGRVGPGCRALFSVPIRTLTLDPASGRAAYHVGSGVTWDAAPGGEFEECQLKTRVLCTPSEAFELVETMRWNGRYFPLLAGHLRRMAASAAYFDFTPPAWDEIIKALEVVLAGMGPARVRLVLAAAGCYRWEIAELPRWPEPVTLALASTPINENDLFLFHKTTRRKTYHRAWERISPGTDDVVLWNSQGRITETTVANIAVRRGKQWFTPPLEDGLLPGVMRQRLLEIGFLSEGSVTREAFRVADEIMVFNSVRGIGRAVLREP